MEINSENCLVCFLDILGYENLIKEMSHLDLCGALSPQIYFYDRLEHLDFPEDIKKMARVIRVQILSDSFIFTLNLEEYLKSECDFNREFLCINMFLQSISGFWFDMCKNTKFFLRGGIAKGQYYQRDLYKKENQFIFSRALVEAYKLQKEADVPRILISEDLFTFYTKHKSMGSLLCKTDIKKGVDFYYLDVYSFLNKYPLLQLEKTLGGVVDSVKYQVSKNKNSRKILNKYYWLEYYHNSKIKEFQASESIKKDRDFIIDIPHYL